MFKIGTTRKRFTTMYLLEKSPSLSAYVFCPSLFSIVSYWTPAIKDQIDQLLTSLEACLLFRKFASWLLHSLTKKHLDEISPGNINSQISQSSTWRLGQLAFTFFKQCIVLNHICYLNDLKFYVLVLKEGSCERLHFYRTIAMDLDSFIGFKAGHLLLIWSLYQCLENLVTYFMVLFLFQALPSCLVTSMLIW